MEIMVSKALCLTHALLMGSVVVVAYIYVTLFLFPGEHFDYKLCAVNGFIHLHGSIVHLMDMPSCLQLWKAMR